jgi:hypothetical protein
MVGKGIDPHNPKKHVRNIILEMKLIEPEMKNH